MTFSHGSLAVEEVAAIFGLPVEKLAGRTSTRLETVVEQHLMLNMASRELTVSGLGPSPSFLSTSAWERRRYLSTQALAKRIGQRLKSPTQDELRHSFEPGKLIRPEMLRISRIILDLDADDPAASYDAAFRLLHAIESGSLSFDQAIKDHSAADPMAGDVGWVPHNKLAARVGIDGTRAVRDLKIGELSGIVEENDRLWIYRLDDRAAERPMTFEEALPTLDRRLGQARTNALEQQITAEILEAIDLESAD